MLVRGDSESICALDTLVVLACFEQRQAAAQQAELVLTKPHYRTRLLPPAAACEQMIRYLSAQTHQKECGLGNHGHSRDAAGSVGISRCASRSAGGGNKHKTRCKCGLQVRKQT